MSGVNKAILIGRMGQDPQIRYTQNGSPVATFSLATSETWRDKNGDKQDRTEWHSCVVWGKLAEIVQKYLVKGSQVYVEGRLQTRKWQDRDGNEKKTTEVIVGYLTMLGGKRQGDGNPNYGTREPGDEPPSSGAPEPDYSGDGSSIPF